MTHEEFTIAWNNMMHRHDGEIQLQGVGYRKAKKAEEFAIGDIMLCNGGYSQKVVAIESCGKTMIKLFVECSNGKIYEKKTRKTTLFAYQA